MSTPPSSSPSCGPVDGYAVQKLKEFDVQQLMCEPIDEYARPLGPCWAFSNTEKLEEFDMQQLDEYVRPFGSSVQKLEEFDVQQLDTGAAF